jgi:hypothetical protein
VGPRASLNSVRRDKSLTRAGNGIPIPNRPACNYVTILFCPVPKYSAGIVFPIPTTNLRSITNQLGGVITKYIY